jgi:adenylylsulfate kinase
MERVHARKEAGRMLPAEAGGAAGAAVRGGTVWLTGLPSAGKSTLAAAVAASLRAGGRAVEVLDGDEVRRQLAGELGFSRRDRDLNVARIGYLAELLARNGVLVLVAAIAPYAEARGAVRKAHEQSGTDFLEVHVATPVSICQERDVKGLYARRAQGLISGLTGVDDPYEVPERPELSLDTSGRSVAESAEAVRLLIEERGLLA